MAATKLLLLLFSVALLGLSSAQFIEEENQEEDSVQDIEDEEDSEDSDIPPPYDFNMEEQEGEEDQDRKTFDYQGGHKKRGRKYGPPGPPQDDVSGGRGPGGRPGRQRPGGPRGGRRGGPQGGRRGGPQGGRQGGPQGGRRGGPQGRRSRAPPPRYFIFLLSEPMSMFEYILATN
ncbi:salivary acidic proline-rich phosphoprotein 1/2-like [Dromiciops gliroides]|uniref:salivary acidic proline-rich phosphoprotein 1/2-like n=1 Tax=Dromiciops gliroides TaxID=33562 RepID=UPI001CC6B7FD|nr:salivary acidic proline-rich phosphoprotein 1/2-like [Dromiciops gliroides]